MSGEEIPLEECLEDDKLYDYLNNIVGEYINRNYYCNELLGDSFGYYAFENPDTGETCYSMSGDDCDDIIIDESGDIAEIRNFGILEDLAKHYDAGKLNEDFRDEPFIEKDICLGEDGTLYTVTHKSSNELMLVFDNIEFSDNSDIEQFAPILAKWCEAAPYKNIAMGNGYNELNSDKIRRIKGIQPPIDTNYIKSIMAAKFSKEIVDCIPEIEDTTFSDEFKNDEFESKLYENFEEASFLEQDEYGDYYGAGPLERYGAYLNDFMYEITQAAEKPYTDADKSCSVLKAEEMVEPYFKDLLEVYYEKHPEEKENPKMEKDSEAEFDTKKKQKKRHTGRGR